MAGYEETIDDFTKVAKNYSYNKRILIPEIAEVYPIKANEIIQTGLYQFCCLVNKTLTNCVTGKFVHKQSPDSYKISRVVNQEPYMHLYEKYGKLSLH